MIFHGLWWSWFYLLFFVHVWGDPVFEEIRLWRFFINCTTQMRGLRAPSLQTNATGGGRGWPGSGLSSTREKLVPRDWLTIGDRHQFFRTNFGFGWKKHGCFFSQFFFVVSMHVFFFFASLLSSLFLCFFVSLFWWWTNVKDVKKGMTCAPLTWVSNCCRRLQIRLLLLTGTKRWCPLGVQVEICLEFQQHETYLYVYIYIYIHIYVYEIFR